MENVKNYFTEQELIAMGVTPIRLTDEQRQKSMRSEGWKTIRKAVFERDNYRSVVSGISLEDEGKQVHHHKYLYHADGTEFEYSEYSDHLDTMMSLTSKEHMAIHGIIYSYQLDCEYETKDRVVGHIYESFEYSDFNFINYNRDVDHWMAILKLMVKYGAIPRVCYVVMINGKRYIVDGQNTFTARQKKGLPILYTVIKVADDDDVQKILLSLNLGGRNFTIKQRSISFEKQGKEAYMKYNKLKNEFSFISDSVIQICINNGGTGLYWKERFENGEMRFSDMEKVQDNINFLNALHELGPNMPKLWSKPNFVNAAICLVKTSQLTYEEMIVQFSRAYKKNSSLLGLRTNARDYYRMIEDIMNFGKSKDKEIHLKF